MNFFHACFGQVEIVFGQPLRFLETVEQNHFAVFHREQHPCDSLMQMDSDFPQMFGQFFDERHAERPTDLHSLDVGADCFLVRYIQYAQTFTDRFIA